MELITRTFIFYAGFVIGGMLSALILFLYWHFKERKQKEYYICPAGYYKTKPGCVGAVCEAYDESFETKCNLRKGV